ncbi:MAG: redoxin domain-containing protein [Chloroflexi bacterium]|jgi:thiol-disulfide isomerase/thioredoxin|nr:redoxin domain-containing protein [Chloroflexota bacterium]MBT5318970.1 redoxin domain-containing protein [Chloroflexota bacterium]
MGLDLIDNKRLLLSIGAVVILAVAACGGSSDSAGSADATSAPANVDVPVDEDSQRDSLLPEITGIANWINSEPTTVEAEIKSGNIVLIDFWTYTCVNCLRTMPHLRGWQEKYADNGLTILGVHSPEFEFEKDTENVVNAVESLGIEWAVAQDNEMETWRAFGNRFWPAKYLFSAEDEIVYSHFGEGDYAETEVVIREQLTAAGHDVSDIPFDPLPPDVRDDEATSQSRELYGGYERSYTQQGIYNGHEEYYSGPDQILEYEDEGQPIDGQYFLNGLWENRAESIVHGREDPDLEDYLRVPFSARSVNIVIEPSGPEPFEVVVELDGEPLTPEQAGTDIVFKDDGTSVLQVSEARLYAVLESPEYIQTNLFFRSTSPNFAMFAFTFGVYLEGA